jgi:large subunit ribosomal protein L4
MKLPLKDTNGNATGEFEVGFPIIENNRGSQAVHDVVVAHLANRRRGTASTKTMGEVAGTGRKPWRQKGTGRARAGSFQSPLWRGGGVVFGPKPRDFSKKVNAKTRQLALRVALSSRLREGDVLVLSELKLPAPKTKEFVRVLHGLDLADKTVLICAGDDPDLRRASRNVPGVDLTTGEQLHTYQVLRYDKLVFTRPAFEKVEQRLKQA